MHCTALPGCTALAESETKTKGCPNTTCPQLSPITPSTSNPYSPPPLTSSSAACVCASKGWMADCKAETQRCMGWQKASCITNPHLEQPITVGGLLEHRGTRLQAQGQTLSQRTRDCQPSQSEGIFRRGAPGHWHKA